ncbi:pyridoxamine 5'-phosphate oxidase family protein [Thauera aromatica]|nr:pyridoxamine 5'-phosphate oxidase family protein [Thauera aromatica]MCK2096152.1 pyridoxamine 5'-phosphate oxidase family protein [Thauera aromatica]
MSAIEPVIQELLDNTEFLTIVTQGPDGPHLVGNWGDYLRRLGVEGRRLVLPAGYYHQTEQNLQRDNRVQVFVAARAVRGSHGPGQGAVLRGTGAIVTEGALAERAKAAFPWARGALVIEVEAAATQL